jgi:D-alanyl-D-alanine carboxypeptidase
LPVKNKTLLVSTQAPLSKQNKTNYIHSDIELDRNMPEYSALTSKSENIYKYLEPTNNIELERNTPVTSFVSNIVGKSSVDNNSKDARLNPKIQAGSFSIPAGVPTISRTDREIIDNARTRMTKSYNNDANARFNMQAVNIRRSD